MDRVVSVDLWRASWFERANQLSRLVYLYLRTGPETRPNGVCLASPRRIAFDLGVQEQEVVDALGELSGQVLCLPEHDAILVRGFVLANNRGGKWGQIVVRADNGTSGEVMQRLVAFSPEDFDGAVGTARLEQLRSRGIGAGNAYAMQSPSMSHAKPMQSPSMADATRVHSDTEAQDKHQDQGRGPSISSSSRLSDQGERSEARGKRESEGEGHPTRQVSGPHRQGTDRTTPKTPSDAEARVARQDVPKAPHTAGVEHPANGAGPSTAGIGPLTVDQVEALAECRRRLERAHEAHDLAQARECIAEVARVLNLPRPSSKSIDDLLRAAIDNGDVCFSIDELPVWLGERDPFVIAASALNQRRAAARGAR